MKGIGFDIVTKHKVWVCHLDLCDLVSFSAFILRLKWTLEISMVHTPYFECECNCGVHVQASNNLKIHDDP